MYHYVYRITHITLNKHYYGCRSTKHTPKEDLGVRYFSSSKDKEFINDQCENPNDYRYKIIRICNTRKEAIKLEIKLHNKFDVGINESFYNRVKQSSNKFDTSGKALYVDENGQHVFISNEEAKKRCLIAVSKGRKWTEEAKRKAKHHRKKREPITEETRQKMSEWQKGKPKWDEAGRKKLSEIHKGKILTEEWKEKIGKSQLGVKKPTKICPHCKFECAANTAKRWHFDNCKHKK